MIVAGHAGKVCARNVELVDLHSTLADLAGLPIPEKLDGISLRPLIENPAAAWDKPALTQVRRGGGKNAIMGYSLRTDKWRYTEWDGGAHGIELYDEENDPAELKNLAQTPESKETLAKLKNQLQNATGHAK